MPNSAQAIQPVIEVRVNRATGNTYKVRIQPDDPRHPANKPAEATKPAKAKKPKGYWRQQPKNVKPKRLTTRDLVCSDCRKVHTVRTKDVYHAARIRCPLCGGPLNRGNEA
jgi:hypothetical protein